ncbi:PREDICTED: UPF0481 protein At3g47200-like [Ipomoea nil]|uniref:UPF0481 protein At3g47200-like n=1 Tax=Ipomoea nil TaxID=35883 RepID=UPI000900F359|nr:PREDICTED: UPF0481 protein At3g47200-like [Ipomoea nil]
MHQLYVLLKNFCKETSQRLTIIDQRQYEYKSNNHVSIMQSIEGILVLPLIDYVEIMLPLIIISLKAVYELMKPVNSDSLELVALKFFNWVLPRRDEEILIHFSLSALEPKHLLDLVYTSYLPSSVNQLSVTNLLPYSDNAIQCVKLLRKSGIKIKPVNAKSLSKINFKKTTLHIPPITINDYTTTFFINCIALEQCTQHTRTYFTAYIAFLSCLITSPKDVTFLSRDEIITRFSNNDRHIAALFNILGENTTINIKNCYLSRQVTEIDSYYSTHWAILMRTCFSTPWSFISAFPVFLVLVFAFIQTVMAILSYTASL